MSFTKITNSELNSRGATTLPNQPMIPAASLKAEFDAPAKQIVAPALNNLIDELEAETAAASIGAEAPTGRTVSDPTVQADINKLSSDLAAVEGQIEEAIADAHTHDNKELLDTYEQTEANLADAVSKKHEHSNKAVLDKFGENASGKPTYNGQDIGGGGSGDMTKAVYDDDDTVADAGGIVAYVQGEIADQITDALTASY